MHILLAAAAVSSLLAVAACSTAMTGSATAAGAPGPTVPCSFTATPTDPAPSGKSVGVPPKSAPKSGIATVALATTAGTITLSLDRTAAPCTVTSFVYLAQHGFFDNTPCHRLTAYDDPPLKVLQCGDPTGTGTGGPGYTIPDENPTNLAAAPASASAAAGTGEVIYPRGTLAMANTGEAHTGGSQFFIVYGDSYLPPSYAVFGTVPSAGQAVLDTIAAAGITPGNDPSTGQATPRDGAPTLKVTISKATATP